MIATELLLWISFIHTAHGSFYFVTHSAYTSSSYNTTSTEAFKIAGDVTTVTQQCRRLCSVKPYCKAYALNLVSGAFMLGKFECEFYSENSCNWKNVSLENATTSPFPKIWEKLEVTDFKAKPCIAYCQVKYQGNCTACRGYIGLSGLDCDVAPRVCADYAPVSLVWQFMPVWPWGFYQRKLSVLCLNSETALIRNLEGGATGQRSVYALGSDKNQTINNMTSYTNWVKRIDWSLLAEMQSISISKRFYFRAYFNGISFFEIYTGLKLGSDGALSLNGSLTIPPSGHFPVPLRQAPFVFQPSGYNISCGAFWRLDNGINVCNYRTHLLNLGALRLNGTYSTASSVSLMFV